MKKLLLIILILYFSGLAAYAPMRKLLYIKEAIPIQPYEKVWEAVCMIESSNRQYAFNKDENAIGIVQVRPVRLRDFNDRTGKQYTMDDMYDVKKSKEVFMYYATQFEYSDPEKIARKWNGSGKKTITYWNKVKVYM
jgi:hypothetical protein